MLKMSKRHLRRIEAEENNCVLSLCDGAYDGLRIDARVCCVCVMMILRCVDVTL